MKIILGILAASGLFAQSGAHGVGYKLPNATGAKPTNVEAKLSKYVDIYNDFGARPDGSDNTARIQAAVTYAAATGMPLTCPDGTYRTHTISVPVATGFTIKGHCTFQSISAEILFQMEAGGVNANIENVTFDCNGIGTYGFLIGTLASPQGNNLISNACTTKGITFDGTQNFDFTNLTDAKSGIGVAVVNGAGNSTIGGHVEVNGQSVKGVYVGKDAALPGFITAIYSNIPFNIEIVAITQDVIGGSCLPAATCNTFTSSVQIEFGTYITLTRPNLGAGPSTTKILDISSTSVAGFDVIGTQVRGGVIASAYDVPFISNKAQSTVIDGLAFLQKSPAVTPYVISGVTMQMINMNTLPTNFSLSDIEGAGAGAAFGFRHATTNGITGFRPTLPSAVYGAPYWDTTINQQIYWNGTAWQDSYGNTPNQCMERRGSGSPNGVVVGSPCDKYFNTAGGAGTTFYVKESGTATNTGWIGK